MALAPVLVIGLDPATSEAWDPEPFRADIQRGRDRFADSGIHGDWCLVQVTTDYETAVVDALTSKEYGCVLVDGGLFRDESLVVVFENVVNLVRQHAPDAAIGFPKETDECVDVAERWLD